ncbi:hypothetical protein QF042_004788 [Pedobacter sp. W3I1]|uniref:hypothetical protein n=1 Tax=Pedobacter sp. W3I1 TaxID=3042291 RepID=UPI002784821C|nr:hypothetical protein [Pedobacter sp. W3I1]MDQ0641223.1 hypothetical protein [Pedobacter sp. W3I1]
MLACFKKNTGFTEEQSHPKWQKNQKNRCRKEQVVLPSLKRSGFVFISAALRVLRILNTNPEGLNQAEEKHKQYLIKQSAAVFLMSVGR